MVTARRIPRNAARSKITMLVQVKGSDPNQLRRELREQAQGMDIPTE